MSNESGTFKAGRELVRRLRGVNPAVYRTFLGERQYLRPRAGIGEVLAEAGDSLGVCRSVVEQTLLAMELDSGTAIGRLRGTDLDRMSRYLHRFGRQARIGTAGRDRGRTGSACRGLAGGKHGMSRSITG